MLDNSTKNTLLMLLRYAIDNESGTLTTVSPDVDWNELIVRATKSGVACLAFDGYVKSGLNDSPDCPLNSREMRKLRLTWMGLEIPQRQKYEQQQKVLRQLQAFYAHHGVEVYVLKGYDVSLCYPKPELRAASDIDIFCPHDYDRSNQLIEQTGVKVDYSEHKHSVFSINGVMVENHHSFLNVHGHRSSRQLEALLEEKGAKSPSAMLLYLMRHSAENFTASQARIKQMLDCGLYARRHHKEIDWQWLTDAAHSVGMNGYVDIIIGICVEYLGFSAELFPEYNVDAQVLRRSLNDIISPEFSDEHPSNIISEIFYKLRRWRANMWKHRLVYANESLVSTFLTQTWSHILKPSSITFGME